MAEDTPIRFIMTPKFPEVEAPVVKYIDVKKEDNDRGKEWRVKGKMFEFAVKIFKDNLGTEPANSLIKVIKRTWLDKTGKSAIEETLIEGVDNSALVKDIDIFEHEYVIRVEEANVAIKGVIRYA